MQITEVFTEGKKKNPELNEDDYFFSENYAAVFDGSTAKTKKLYRGKTTGKNASEVLKSALSEADANCSETELTNIFNAALQKFYEEEKISALVRENPHERCAASIVLFSQKRREIYFWGDCSALVGENVYFWEKKIDTVLAEMRSVILEIALAEGQNIDSLRENDLGRAYIQPIIIKGAMFQNAEENRFSPYYYEKIDGFGAAIPQKIVVPENVAQIVLASDGYPKVLASLEQSEKYLREIIADDPLLFRKFKATKAVLAGQNSFDDRTYLRFIC